MKQELEFKVEGIEWEKLQEEASRTFCKTIRNNKKVEIKEENVNA